MWYKRTAAEVMEPQPGSIYKHANLIDLLALISSNEKLNKENYIAVLESAENPVLVGSFKVKHAIDYVFAECHEIESKLVTGAANSDYSFQKFFQSLKNEAGIEMNTAGDSSVVQISKDLMKFLNDMIIYETKYHYEKGGKIIEEKVLVGGEHSPRKRYTRVN